MKAGPVGRAVRGGLTRKRTQTVVVGLVLLISTGAAVLALALLVDSHAPFDHAFAAQHGADLVVTFDPATATAAELATTGQLDGVTAAAGPFPTAAVTTKAPASTTGPTDFPAMLLAGRSSPGGPVDDVVLQSGHWPRRAGQLVLDTSLAGSLPHFRLGTTFTVVGTPAKQTLTVVGIASSVTGSAEGWVTPAEIARLTTHAQHASTQMLYRFSHASTAAQVAADARIVARALPAGAVTGTQTWLAADLAETGNIAAFVPFLIAFGFIGLVMSVLIVTNVVSGAVVAGYRRIGILKSIGFSPAQVVAAYVGQAAAPAVVGCAGGVVLGDLLAAPVLGKAATLYNVGSLTVPVWIDVTVPVTMLLLVGLAAVLPALRAGRLSAVQAIAIGRAPGAGRGYAAHRLLGRLSEFGRLRLPRPVTVGLAAPFARPARTSLTLTAILLGATVVTFAVGLSSSLNRVVAGLSRSKAVPIEIMTGPLRPAATAQRTTQATLRTEPDIAHYAAEYSRPVVVSGLSQQVALAAYRGNANWTGYAMISGHWYTGPGLVDVASHFLTVTGKAVGDMVTIVADGRSIPVRIAGEVFTTRNDGFFMITDWRTLSRNGLGRTLVLDQYEVGLRPGVSASAFARTLQARLGKDYFAVVNNVSSDVIDLMISLIGTLTLLLIAVAGLGVLNTIVLHTRERVHDLGVFKAVGMTPRQTVSMVVCWVAGTGLAASVIAVPLGVAVHGYVLPAMARSVDIGLPASFLHVYNPAELALLGLTGIAIAVAGALLPATWAASITTATALRAE